MHPYNAAEIERLQKRPEEDFSIVVHNTGLECSNGSLKIVECNVPVDEIRQDELKCEKEIKFKTNTIAFDRYKKAIERVVMSLPYGDFEFIRKLSQDEFDIFKRILLESMHRIKDKNKTLSFSKNAVGNKCFVSLYIDDNNDNDWFGCSVKTENRTQELSFCKHYEPSEDKKYCAYHKPDCKCLNTKVRGELVYLLFNNINNIIKNAGEDK